MHSSRSPLGGKLSPPEEWKRLQDPASRGRQLALTEQTAQAVLQASTPEAFRFECPPEENIFPQRMQSTIRFEFQRHRSRSQVAGAILSYVVAKILLHQQQRRQRLSGLNGHPKIIFMDAASIHFELHRHPSPGEACILHLFLPCSLLGTVFLEILRTFSRRYVLSTLSDTNTKN